MHRKTLVNASRIVVNLGYLASSPTASKQPDWRR